VNDLDLDVPPGLCFGLLGPNGAGKTTLLRMIYGVTRPTAGTLHVFGIDVSRDPRAVRARLGVTLQENVLIGELTPEENLRVFGRYHLLREPELTRRTQTLLDFLDLRSHADMPVSTLSGGFQRRLAIAMSLVNEPELLVLDEPTTGLDPAVRLALWSRVRALRDAGTSVLLTTHYMDEAERLCDRVAILSEGRRVCEGRPRELIEQSEGRRVCEGRPRELIEQRLAREAVEIDCSREAGQRILDGTRWPHVRSGDRLIVYTDEPARVVSRAQAGAGGAHGSLAVRPTNLEDVFLAETGTRLEERS
jgi:lipooligosaccharide transport system ATP-binding protein